MFVSVCNRCMSRALGSQILWSLRWSEPPSGCCESNMVRVASALNHHPSSPKKLFEKQVLNTSVKKIGIHTKLSGVRDKEIGGNMLIDQSWTGIKVN